MPIYYNQPSYVNVNQLVDVLNLVADKHKVVLASSESPLYSNNPNKDPVLLVIFVDDVSLDNLIRTVFPLWNQAKFERIVVSLKQPIEVKEARATFVFNTDAVANRSVDRIVAPTNEQETAFKTAIEGWIKNPLASHIVPEVLIYPLQIGFMNAGAIGKAAQLIKRIRADIAYAKFATREVDSKEAVGLVIWNWEFQRAELDVNNVVATVKRFNRQFQKMIIVWVNSGVPANRSEDVLLEIPAIPIKSGLTTDMGWGITPENQEKVIEVLTPFAKDENKQINWNKLVFETSKLLDNDALRDWLGAVRWKPLASDSALSLNEQYARMQALPPRDRVPSQLTTALERQIGKDPQVLTLSENLQQARKQIDDLLVKRRLDEKPLTESKSSDVSKLKEQISRQDQTIATMKMAEGKAKEMNSLLQQEVEDLKANQKEMGQAHAEQIKELTAKLQAAEAKVKEISADAKQKEEVHAKQVQEWTAKLQAAEAKAATVVADAKQKETEPANQIKMLSERSNVKPVEEKQQPNLDQELKELDQELEKEGVVVSSEIDKLRADLKRKDELLKRVESDLQKIKDQRRVEALARQPDTELQAEVKKLANELEEERKKSDGLRRELVVVMAEKKEATERQVPMLAQIDQLQKEKDNLLTENKNLVASTDKLLKANETMTREINELTEKVNRKSQVLAAMNSENPDEVIRDWKEIIDLWKTESQQLFWTRRYLEHEPTYAQVKEFINLSEPRMQDEYLRFQKSKNDAAKPKVD